jgi:hypothetical protein
MKKESVITISSLTKVTVLILGSLGLVFQISAIANAGEGVEFRVAGKCLDADSNRDGANGTNVQLWECHGGLNQKWRIKDSKIESVAYPGMVLDADSNRDGANGTNVQLWQDNNGFNQRWKIEDSKIRSVAYPDRILDVDSNRNAENGSNLQLWQDLNSANQKFQIR